MENKERLIIKNFGPIQKVELELGKMTVLIGDQATGKTTVAKVLAVCRYFSYLDIIDKGLIDWGLEGFANEKTTINYLCKDYELKCYAIKTGDRFMIKQDLKELSPRFVALRKEYKSLRSITDSEGNLVPIPLEFFFNQVRSVMDNPYFLGTERELQSIFSLGIGSMKNLSDYLFNQFAQLDYITRRFKNEIEIEPLGILYKNDSGQGYIKKIGESKYHNLYHGASGYKAAVPIVLVIKNFNLLEKRSKTFIIEEPEISLFPEKQKKLVEFFVASLNSSNNPYFLNTHSPYILSALNNLMYAYTIGNINNGEFSKQASKIIPKDNWLNPDHVRVYYLDKSGKSIPIIDEAEKLINTDYIDSVSSIINAEFERLLAIEVEHLNKNQHD